MASRMDRYNKNELISSGRSSRNKSLYEQIEDLGSYTNIEGVATIDKTNEIDITKVKEMLKNRENYKKQKKLKSILKEEKEILEEKIEPREEPKKYDIKEMLSKININEEKPKYRSLEEEQYKLLESLSKKNKDYDIEKEENELKELIQTIAGNKDDVGLLDELKSDTVVGDASSIKKIIEEEKEIKTDENTMELDKSFYTSSFEFTKSDFDELKEINHKIKKGNKFIIILLIVMILIVILGVLFFIFK